MFGLVKMVLMSDDCSPHDLKSIFDKVCGDYLKIVKNNDIRIIKVKSNKMVAFNF